MSFQALHTSFSTSILISAICLISAVTGKSQSSDVLITFKDVMAWHGEDMPRAKADKGWYVYEQLHRQAERSQRDVRAFLEAKGIPYTGYTVVNAIHAVVPDTLIAALLQMEEVAQIARNSPFREERTIDANVVITRSVGPEWGILHIHADSVWSLGVTGQGVVIGGQDTGYEWDHPVLREKYRGYDNGTVNHDYNWHDAIHEINPLNGDSIPLPENNRCGLNSAFPCDDAGHGTHTMGTMVGSDTANQTGVAPGAQWIACRNMERGWGSPATYLECMEWFLAPTDHNNENPDPSKAPHVINNSWSCPEVEGCNPSNWPLMRQAVMNLRAAGIVVVVSAGNSGSQCGTVETPLAMFEESFTIGAINSSDTIAGFSSRGPVEVDSSFRMKPNVSAPGVQVRSSWINGGFRNASGTSMAGPHVAGVVALMISANPELAGQVETIEDILESTARPRMAEQECGGVAGSENINNTFGYGVVDALAAVEAALLVSDVHEPGQYTGSPFVFYPNPVTDQLHVMSRSVTQIHTLRVFTPEGRVVCVKQEVSLPGQVDLASLPAGLYFIQADQSVPERIQVIH